MAFFAEDDNLDLSLPPQRGGVPVGVRCPQVLPSLGGAGGGFILLLDALLQLQHYGAGGVDDFDVVLACQLVGLRGFAMCAQQHLDIVQLGHFVVIDGYQSHVTQAFALHAVMHDIAQAIELIATGQFLLGLLYGRGHAKAEATAAVNLYL